jgi:hypothetical protein
MPIGAALGVDDFAARHGQYYGTLGFPSQRGEILLRGFPMGERH